MADPSTGVPISSSLLSSSSSSVRDIIGTIAVVPFGTQRLPELQTLYANRCCDVGERNAERTRKAGTITITTTTTTSASTTTSNTIRALQSGGRKLSHIRHLRRRATSHKRYRQYKSSNYHYRTCSSNSNSNDIIPQIRQPRRKVRRQNVQQLCHRHEVDWWNSNPSKTRTDRKSTPPPPSLQLSSKSHDFTNEERDDYYSTTATITTKAHTGTGTASRATNVTQKWMTTHLFHRKRCHMATLWNWYVPLLHMNRGGAAALRLVTTTTTIPSKNITTTIRTSLNSEHHSSQLKSKCLIQDTTWAKQPIWFRIVTHPIPSSNGTATSTCSSTHESIHQQLQSALQNMIPDFYLLEKILTHHNNSNDINHDETTTNTATKVAATSTIIVSDDGCMIHEPFRFPSNAIGPITWIYKKGNRNFHDPDIQGTNDYIYFFVHPSIQTIVFQHLDEMMMLQVPSIRATTTNDTGVYGPYMGNTSSATTCQKNTNQTGIDDERVDGAMSCFQLRGSNESCLDCFMKCFSKHPQRHSHMTMAAIRNPMNDHNNHVSNRTTTEPRDEDRCLPLYHFLQESPHHNDIAEFHLPMELLSRHYQHHHGPSNTDPNTPTDKIDSKTPRFAFCLRRVCPRDVSVPCNWGVCGYDIYCPPRYSKVLFQNLILQGGACMIGIVEEAYIALECCPPLLLFPRDYPDTKEGQEYWNSHSSTEWKVLRHYWEGGGGRISKIKMGVVIPKVDTHNEIKYPVSEVATSNISKGAARRRIVWKKVLRPNGDDNDNNNNNTVPVDEWEQSVVVVRNKEFIRPFESVLSGCTHFSHNTKESDRNTERSMTRKRKHRSTNKSPRLEGSIVEAARLSHTQRHHHHQVCQSLFDNLSLPAVLMCLVQLIGKGTLQPGAGIFSSIIPQGCADSEINDRLLGWVTAGSFSMARGCYYGVGMIGAKAFLASLMDCIAVHDTKNDNAMDVVRPKHHRQSIMIHSCSLSRTKSVQLKVSVENPNDPSIRYDGTLSLL